MDRELWPSTEESRRNRAPATELSSNPMRGRSLRPPDRRYWSSPVNPRPRARSSHRASASCDRRSRSARSACDAPARDAADRPCDRRAPAGCAAAPSSCRTPVLAISCPTASPLRTPPFSAHRRRPSTRRFSASSGAKPATASGSTRTARGSRPESTRAGAHGAQRWPTGRPHTHDRPLDVRTRPAALPRTARTSTCRRGVGRPARAVRPRSPGSGAPSVGRCRSVLCTQSSLNETRTLRCQRGQFQAGVVSAAGHREPGMSVSRLSVSGRRIGAC